jgi:hypothetical protein
MNKRPVGGRNSETWSHPIDMNNNNYQTTRCNIREDRRLRTRRGVDLKSQLISRDKSHANNVLLINKQEKATLV